MTVRLRASFLEALAEAHQAMRVLAGQLPEAQTTAEQMALLQAINRQALSVIVMVNDVLDA